MRQKQKETGRIIVTVFSQIDQLEWETVVNASGFYTIPVLSGMGYQVEDHEDTEADYYNLIDQLVCVARQEKSRVLVLGSGPHAIPPTWVKIADLIIHRTDVETVLIPFATRTDAESLGADCC